MAKKEEDLIDSVVEKIQKEHGEDSLRRGLTTGVIACDVIPTKCLALDLALGVGGVPKGRIIEIYGPEASGKTTLAMTVVANAQAEGDLAAYIDSEHSFDPKYAAALGVKLDDILFSQPDSGEQVMQIVEQLVLTRKVGVIVVDSVAGMTPKAILEGNWDDRTMAALAQLMSKGLGKLKAEVRRSNTSLIFTNQLRDKVGAVMPGASPDVTPGGRALKFYASMRLDIRRIGSVNEGGSDTAKIGNSVRVKVAKNKVAPPFREAEFIIMFGKGISRSASIIDVGIDNKIITKNGSFLNYNDTKLGNGYMNCVSFLESNPNLMAEIDKSIREKLLPKPTLESSVEEEEK